MALTAHTNSVERPAVVRPEEREWERYPSSERGDCAWRTMISGDITPSRALSSGVVDFESGKQGLAPHRHAEPEIYYIVAGGGEVTIDGKPHAVEAGATVYIPGDAEHSVRNTGTGTLRIFYVFPTDRFSDVVYRFTAEAGR